MRGVSRALAGLWIAAMATLAASGAAQAQQCTKADFAAVVDEAAANLRALTQQNSPQFQVKLRHLRDKRGWSYEQFLKEAAPYVRDERIAAFDQKAEEFLGRITSGGQAQAAAATPDCKLLAELRTAMGSLVETQKAKWAYMFEKIDRELAK